MRAKNLEGMRFGKLVVRSRAQVAPSGKLRWACLCDCGKTSDVQTSNLTTGHTKSCGCEKLSGLVAMNGKASLKHGMHRSATYGSWSAMRERCFNTRCNEYAIYGGRGISVCERWNSFGHFFEDMGERPHGMTLDRIDVDGNYEPSNCRWATPKQQGRNRRNNHVLTFDGRSQTISAWAEELQIGKTTIRQRLVHGWTTKDALSVSIGERSRWNRTVEAIKRADEQMELSV